MNERHEDELDILTSEIERCFLRLSGWKTCRHLLGKLVESRDKELAILEAKAARLDAVIEYCDQIMADAATIMVDEGIRAHNQIVRGMMANDIMQIVNGETQ